MCNQAICPSDTAFSCLPTEMDSAASSSPAAASDEPPRVKFLCSFGGGILPRPLDGRLRYVGGETRIVSVPRDVSYDELMVRMRELFEGAAVIKYQQPEEDLDSLVSVMSDDDVMNMMEEYDKLGASGDGFTRLRIFLFSQQQTELEVAAATASHFGADDWETERRYVDALNSLTDTKIQAQPDGTDQLFGLPGIEGGMLTHLHHLNIPKPPRYGDVDPQWSPAFYSPGHHTPHDPRDFPSSPSSARYQFGVREFGDRISPEEYVRHSPGYPTRQYDRQSPSYFDSVVWLPPGAIVQEKAGFPTNLGLSNNVVEGSNVCENCRMEFQRSQPTMPDAKYIDPRWKHGQPYMEQMSAGNEYVPQFPNSCARCYHGHEAYMPKHEVKPDHGIYVKEQRDQAFYNESHGHDGGWALHHHPLNHRLEDSRLHPLGTGRASEHYVMDANMMKLPYLHSHIYDAHSVHSNYVNPDDTRYVQPVNELGNEMLHSQQMGGGAPHVNVLGREDTGARYGDYPSALDNLSQFQHNLPPLQPLQLRSNVQPPLHQGPSCDLGMAMPSGMSPRYSGLGVDEPTQIAWAAQNNSVQQKIFRLDGSPPPENLYEHGSQMNPNIICKDSHLLNAPHCVKGQPGTLHVEVPGEAVPLVLPSSRLDGNKAAAASGDHLSSTFGSQKVAEGTIIEKGSLKKEIVELDSKGLMPTEENSAAAVVSDADAGVIFQNGNISVESLSFLPEMIASAKKAILEEAEEVKAKAEENSGYDVQPISRKKEPSQHELEPGNSEVEVDADPVIEQPPKIEPTTAEAEALAKGLQTIQNADLEEIRQLGSGTYGAVFHGKWKGSDVAIKRIKASCFDGRPSERERLIADFWKEALILSSLHHPNVVSFYGIVRDGPDGTLATVTEFMINGSLKQFLQKKDRTIDRRKRLILAMDAAFGMEYLHGKNIVHFDLKCENLLVNMRDPHRPICKIGDLGLSKVKQHTLVSGGVRGTLPWMAPELLSGKSHMVTEKIDVYSFGIVMWELLTGEEPYTDMRCASIIGGIVNNTLRPQIPTWCDPEWKSLMESCWSADPVERPSFSEISQKLRKMSAAINVK